MEIGKSIKRIRKLRGISQVELSVQCNITQSYLSRVEAGSSLPSLPLVLEIANVLLVSEELIFLNSIRGEGEVFTAIKEIVSVMIKNIKN